MMYDKISGLKWVMCWKYRKVKQRLGGSITHTEGDLCTFSACRCVKLWGSLRRWKGLGGHKTQSRCCPTETAQLCCPWLIATLLLKWCRFLFKNQIFSVWQMSAAILCLFCGLISLFCCGVSSQRSPRSYSPLCLRSSRSVPGCSNKYDKWGYRCLKNELWLESLWCLTLLMKYLDESMYSHFVLRMTHCSAIEHVVVFL